MAKQIKWTKALIDLIAGCIFDGLTDEETGILAGINRKTIYRIRLGDECPAIKRATIARMRHYIALIRDARENNNHWQRIAWFLERRYPDRWAKPEVLLNLNTGANSVTNNTLVITAEQAEGLKARNAILDQALSKLSPPASRTGPIIPIMSPEHIGDEVSETNTGAGAGEILTADVSTSKTVSDSVVEKPPGATPTRTPDDADGDSKPNLPPNFKSVESYGNSKKNSRNSKAIPQGGIVKPLKKKKGIKILENFEVLKGYGNNKIDNEITLKRKPGRPKKNV
jgi:hypothetical protein